jgi:hypothetical protein
MPLLRKGAGMKIIRRPWRMVGGLLPLIVFGNRKSLVRRFSNAHLALCMHAHTCSQAYIKTQEHDLDHQTHVRPLAKRRVFLCVLMCFWIHVQLACHLRKSPA